MKKHRKRRGAIRHSDKDKMLEVRVKGGVKSTVQSF